jgi:S1-C subfamily serine protease
VEGADEVSVVFADGDDSSAEVVARDALTDIAVLRAARDGLPAADFARTSASRPPA